MGRVNHYEKVLTLLDQKFTYRLNIYNLKKFMIFDDITGFQKRVFFADYLNKQPSVGMLNIST